MDYSDRDLRQMSPGKRRRSSLDLDADQFQMPLGFNQNQPLASGNNFGASGLSPMARQQSQTGQIGDLYGIRNSLQDEMQIAHPKIYLEDIPAHFSNENKINSINQPLSSGQELYTTQQNEMNLFEDVMSLRQNSIEPLNGLNIDTNTEILPSSVPHYSPENNHSLFLNQLGGSNDSLGLETGLQSPTLSNEGKSISIDQAKQNIASSTYEESNANEETIAAAGVKDSLSEEEDMVYVPFEYQGDGRKREAKRHKSQVMVAQEEIAVDQLIREYQNQNEKIVEIENELECLKTQSISKKELQSKRNRLTAQLSRDRLKLEMSFLKAMAVNYQRLLKRLDKKLCNSTCSFCPKCKETLQNTLMHHKSNLASPQQINELANQSNSASSEISSQPEKLTVSDKKLKDSQKRKKLNISESERIEGSTSEEVSSPVARSKVGEKRKNKQVRKSKNGLTAAATVMGVAGLLSYVDQIGGQQPGMCPTNLVAVNEADMPPSNPDLINLKDPSLVNIGDMQLIEHQEFDYMGQDLDEFDVQRILEVAERLKQSTSLVPALESEKYHQISQEIGQNHTKFSLDDTYLAFDLREAYLQRQSNPYANQADSTFLASDDFETKSCNLWRDDGLQQDNIINGTGENGLFLSHQDKYELLDQQTQSLYCPAASLISAFKPEDKNEGGLVPADSPYFGKAQNNEKGTNGISFDLNSDQDQMLHLVMPANSINMLNGIDNESIFSSNNKKGGCFGSGTGIEDDYEHVMLEVSCKVQEVNKVFYRSSPIDASSYQVANYTAP